MHQFDEHINTISYKNNLLHGDSYPGAWKSLWSSFPRDLEEHKCWKSEKKDDNVLSKHSYSVFYYTSNVEQNGYTAVTCITSLLRG